MHFDCEIEAINIELQQLFYTFKSCDKAVTLSNSEIAITDSHLNKRVKEIHTPSNYYTAQKVIKFYGIPYHC
jgi:hypothetical protein